MRAMGLGLHNRAYRKRGERKSCIVLIGVSHWHTPFYSDPVLGMKDATIVGVSDPDAERAAPLAAQAKCAVFTDYREMCAKLKPDFAFALGHHRDTAEQGRFLIESRIPFAMEKPCALNAAEAQDIARRAAAARVRHRAAGDALPPSDRGGVRDVAAWRVKGLGPPDAPRGQRLVEQRRSARSSVPTAKATWCRGPARRRWPGWIRPRCCRRTGGSAWRRRWTRERAAPDGTPAARADLRNATRGHGSPASRFWWS
jgi:Ni/Co efflux regulator RcnB